MSLCLNTFVIQPPDGLLDTYSVTVPHALLLRYAHRGHCKDEESYKEYWFHPEFSISLTRSRWNCPVVFYGIIPSNPPVCWGGVRVLDCLIFLWAYRLDAACFKSFPAARVRSDHVSSCDSWRSQFALLTAFWFDRR